MAKKKQTEFGIAMRNFTKYPEMPSAQALIDYGVRMEELGYELLWAWDHILLGVEPNFPIHEALTILTAVAARTSKIKIGTGILVLPMRNPVHPGQGARHHRPHLQRPADRRRGGRLVQARVRLAGRRLPPARQDHGAEPGGHQPALDRGEGRRRLSALQAARRGALSQARAEAAPADPDRRLRRCGAQARGHQGRRLAHLLLHGRELRARLGQGPRLRRGGRARSRYADLHQPAADLHRRARPRSRRR